MSLKDDKQQNTQIELDFSSALTGEAREAGKEGAEPSGAMTGTENQPAFRPYSRNASVTVSNRRVRTRTHGGRSEEHTSELQSPCNLVCRLLLEKKTNRQTNALESAP